MVGPVFVVLISQRQSQILNKHGTIHNNPWHFMSSLPFHENSVYSLHRRHFE